MATVRVHFCNFTPSCLSQELITLVLTLEPRMDPTTMASKRKLSEMLDENQNTAQDEQFRIDLAKAIDESLELELIKQNTNVDVGEAEERNVDGELKNAEEKKDTGVFHYIDDDFDTDMALAIQQSLQHHDVTSVSLGEVKEELTGSSVFKVPQLKTDKINMDNRSEVTESRKNTIEIEKKPKRSQIFDCYPDCSIVSEDIPSEPSQDLEEEHFKRDMSLAIRDSLATYGSSRFAGLPSNQTSQVSSSSHGVAEQATKNSCKDYARQATAKSFDHGEQLLDYRKKAALNFRGLVEQSTSEGHREQAASSSIFRGQVVQAPTASRQIEQAAPNIVNKAWETQRNDLQNFRFNDGEQNRMFREQGNNDYAGKKVQDDLRRARALQKAMELLKTSLDTMPAEGDLEEQPLSLAAGIKLFHHQKQALAFLLWRESQHPRGGILADDMGLGKTLTMISLVLKHREIEAMNRSQNGEEDAEGTGRFGMLIKSKTTLIVCPASLLDQWKKEVETKVKPGKLKVLVYHGSKRTVSCKELAKFDIVITTYGTVQAEVKSQLGDKIEKDAKIKLVDLGAAEDLCSTKGRSELLGVAWQRIILDEAHIIRNPKSLTSLAICRLPAERRWCLTGTPINNKELDLYTLIRFLRCSPFDEYEVWKKIDNKSVRGMERMNTLVKSLLLRRLKETKVPMTGRCIVELPQKIIVKLEVDLTPQEREVYNEVFSFAQELLERFMSQKIEKERVQELGYRGSRKSNSRPATRPRTNDTVGAAINKPKAKIGGATGSKNLESGNGLEMPDEVKMYHLLVLLLRLRQICCHPRLIKSMLESDEEELDLQGENGHEEEIVDPKVLCFNNPVFDEEYVSSKVRIVSEELSSLKKKQDETGFVEKIVIVSQWTKLLDLVKFHVEKIGMSYCEIKGKIAVRERGKIVDEFNKNPYKPEVMFLSLAAGGVGLNLVGANHLFLLDMHWNPQQEAQACDRIYRVGQIREVKIHKFLIEDSIEERVLLLQEKKLKLANDVLTGAKRSGVNKLTLDDLKMLFQIN